MKERDFWDDYQAAYELAITATASPHAPWFVVPADDKPFAHLVVAEAMIEALGNLELKIPELPQAERKSLEEARAKLEAE
jgi:polyphosphate kinase 2 (PPK2 family)